VSSDVAPPAEGTVLEGPVSGDSASDDSVSKGPALDESVSDESVADGPVLDDLVTDGPVSDGPVSDGPVSDGPVSDGPVSDGPVSDGPVSDGIVLDDSASAGTLQPTENTRAIADSASADAPAVPDGPATAAAVQDHPDALVGVDEVSDQDEAPETANSETANSETATPETATAEAATTHAATTATTEAADPQAANGMRPRPDVPATADGAPGRSDAASAVPARAAATTGPRPAVPPTQGDLEATQPMPAAEEHATGFGGLAGAPTGRRVRARLARFNAPWQSTQVSEVLEPLIATHRASHPKADVRALQKAFDVAARWHSGQYRKSGDPYITHPLAVATILANLGMDTTTLVAALLHDTIEDTDYSLEQMRNDFGPEVTLLVDGVTKLDRVKLGDAAKAETIRKMVVAMAKDPRVLVIKLADRPAAGQAGAEGQGDARDPGPAGPPARYEHDQVGA
jgi:guanosine-3',5'-bis(diphosphate) 3'-pyrophosphohydrolase